MALALDNPMKVDMPLNKETKLNQIKLNHRYILSNVFIKTRVIDKLERILRGFGSFNIVPLNLMNHLGLSAFQIPLASVLLYELSNGSNVPVHLATFLIPILVQALKRERLVNL